MIKIYIYTNLKDNNKKYIGQTSCKTLEERAGSNFVNYKESWKFYSAIKEFGAENFKREIYAEVDSEDEADRIETELIAKYSTQNSDFGYNIQPGGSNFIMNDEIREKIGISVKKSKRFIENNFKSHAKKVVAISISDRKFTIFDSLTLAAESIGVSRGNIGSICHGKGRAISLKGYLFRFDDNFSEDQIDDYINTYNERKEQQYGISRNKKMANTLREKYKNNEINFSHLEKKVICVETNVIYNSIKDAAAATSTCQQNISQVCNGKRKTANGLHWKFL